MLQSFFWNVKFHTNLQYASETSGLGEQMPGLTDLIHRWPQVLGWQTSKWELWGCWSKAVRTVRNWQSTFSRESGPSHRFIWVWPTFPVCGSSLMKTVKTSAVCPSETGFLPCHQELDRAVGPMTAAFCQLMWPHVQEVPTPLSSRYLRFWEMGSIFSL